MKQENGVKNMPGKLSKIREYLRNKDKQVIIFIAVALALSVFTYAAISVNNFNGGYSPPSALNIRWGDYWTSSSMTTLNTSNAVTSYPRWTAEYKYRTIFIGMGRSGSSYNPPNNSTVWMYIVYSKKPVSDLFTFEYVPNGDRSSTSLNKKGYIRAYIPNDKYNVRDASQNPVSDVFIKCTSTTDFTNFMVSPVIASDLGDIGLYSGAYASGNNHYFEFDFYYECAGEHQQNAYPLTIDGLRSVSNIPYAYILKCEEHYPPGGGATSGSSSGGGTSSGSSSGGTGGHGSPNVGGKDRDGSSYTSTSSWTWDGSSSRPDLELSVPDDWKTAPGNSSTDKYTWEDDRNIPDLDWHLDEEPYNLKGDGDTGERGGTWEIPEFDMEMKPPITGEDANIPPMPGDGLLHNDDSDWKPDFEYGWPPSNPLYG